MTTGIEGRDSAASVKMEATAYDKWAASIGIPIHRGYFIDDLRTLELGWWAERECNSAFIQLTGQEGASENRVTEIAPKATLPPLNFGMDEAIYVLEGRGLTTVWSNNTPDNKRTFEWNKYSMFCIPRNHTFQLSNADGQAPARLLHFNYLPLITGLGPDPARVVNNDDNTWENDPSEETDLYAEAAENSKVGPPGRRNVWSGNFFPDLLAWDKLIDGGRPGGGRTVTIHFKSPIRTHMSVFPVGSYWPAHRHGPGVSIVIPRGEGYAVMWQEGGEKIVVPWHEASLYVPPDRWFHQHFNVSATETRYLAFHLPIGMSTGWRSLPGDTIPFAEEDPFLRERWVEELGKRGMKTTMPDEVYTNPDLKWSASGGGTNGV